ncbi:MAG: nucleotidyltransferase domain-containing protein [Prevotella sp.]
MEQEFKDFIFNITLTSTQSSDAQTKYTGVCEKLFSHFYPGEYDDGKKYLFGSYKTKTNVRPLTSDQDVDVLFKIPQEVYYKYDQYQSNGQAALLQEVRKVLKEKYTTTDKIKAWGKVVLVVFSENHHNVELLPALEQEDKTFLIPNSEDGGKWELFDPRAEVNRFNESNNITSGLTRDLAKMLKAWAHENTSMNYKSCKRLDDIIDFLDTNYPNGKGNECLSKVVFDFFDYMRNKCDDTISSFIITAYSRAQKALEYDDNGKCIEASCEWRKIFGTEFPKATANKENRSQVYQKHLHAHGSTSGR